LAAAAHADRALAARSRARYNRQPFRAAFQSMVLQEKFQALKAHLSTLVVGQHA